MKDRCHVFLSYNHNNQEAAVNLRGQLEGHGLSVFRDEESIHAGDLWLDRLQEAVGGCGSFVVLVGHDGVRRWIGAETQVALNRYFAPQDDALRLPIFPILLGDAKPETLPAFLRLFQATPWNGTDPLPKSLLEQIRKRTIVASKAVPFKGCPFVGLAAYRIDQAHLFFGRHKETLDALACFFDIRPGNPPVRWLEINGNSGSGKSSLMQAGLLPLAEQGWLWRPRTGYERWQCIGPMMPGERPMEMLAETLARAFRGVEPGLEMTDVRKRLEMDDASALSDWLRTRKQDGTAFLLAINQFEELFTFADADERRQFDRLLAGALANAGCPLFVISTMRSDFLDRFAEDLPQLVAVRNRSGRPWTLAPISDDGLREVIDEPARLAGIDVSEVRDWILAEARDEPGALPLVENALHYLWEQHNGNRLSGRLFNEQGGLAGILNRSADDLLESLGEPQRTQALELLFRLVRVDREGSRHARQRIGFDEAVTVAGGGEVGRVVVNRLSGQRRPDSGGREGPLRLITITEEGRSINLIHETLIRSKGLGADGEPQPYWPTLWDYIEKNKERAAWLKRLQADTRQWLEKQKNVSYQWPHERVREAVAALRQVGPELRLSENEHDFLGPIYPAAMLAELEQSKTTHRRRALIGERLDVLGDPRPAVGVDRDGTPVINWGPVKGGKVIVEIRSDPNDPYSDVVATRPRPVKPFRIARYPVTVAQYRAFLQAEDGWCNPQWWADDLHRDPKGNSYKFGHFGNHPMVYVSWFDAVAFCRWLSLHLDFTVRLPDEWEWQQAATGGDVRRVYPWGADWDPEKEPQQANTFESLLGATTAVGMYPAGTSLTGALDMAGTVWEWCLNKFDEPEVTLSLADNFDRRVLRGGSWHYHRAYAQSAFRYWRYPYYRYNSVGFRVVCSSPSSDPDQRQRMKP